MSIKTTFTVELVQFGNTIDITSRTLGANIQQSVQVGSMGYGKAVLTLDNNDGAFTPFNEGTYSGINIYAFAIIIKANIITGSTATVNVFGGLVQDFSFVDDGRNSQVQLMAEDILTVAGRSKVAFLNADPDVYSFPDLALSFLLNGYSASGTTIFAELELPDFGAEDVRFNVSEADIPLDSGDPPYAPFVVKIVGYDDNTIADVINAALLPCGPAVFIPTSLEFITISGVTTALVNCKLLYGGLVPSSSGRKDFVFADDPSGDELPLQSVDRGFNMDDVVNSAQITRNDPLQFGGAPTETRTATSAKSVAEYGIRNVEFGQVAHAWDVLTANFGFLEHGSQQTAERWANMFDTPRFFPRKISLTSKQVEGLPATSTASTQWAAYLNIGTGVWNTGRVVYTPTGASAERTDRVVVASRIIEITPTNATVTIDCLPMQDNMSFVLDNSDLGKLGGSTDTYEESGYTYDMGVGYDSEGADEGNRLR